MDKLSLFNNIKEKLFFFFALFILFSFNIFHLYIDYDKFKNEEIFKTDATIINIYKKAHHKVIKIKTNNFTCFTSMPLSNLFVKYQDINLYLLTKNISFYDYLKGFYTKNFNLLKYDYRQTNCEG